MSAPFCSLPPMDRNAVMQARNARIDRFMRIVSRVSEGLQALVALVPAESHDRAFEIAKLTLLDLSTALGREVRS